MRGILINLSAAVAQATFICLDKKYDGVKVLMVWVLVRHMDTPAIEGIKKKVRTCESEIVSLCSKLIRFPTVSPGETRECADFIKSYFDDLGIETSFHEKKRNKTNVRVKLPGKQDRKLIWLGHLDVVPAGLPEKWTHEPFGGEVVDGRVYGRGSGDMKGSCAAAMVAAKVLSETDEDMRAAVDLWFTCDEETGAHDGTRWLVEKGLLSGEVCLIGDAFGSAPRQPSIDAGCKGYLRMRIRASGKTAHASAPFRGDNAIDKLVSAVERAKRIRDYAFDLPEGLKPLAESTIRLVLKEKDWTESQKSAILRLFNYPTFSLDLIEGGVKLNVVPDSAEASFDIRVTPGVDPKLVEREIFGMFEGVGSEGLQVETIGVEDGYYERWDIPFAESLKKAVRLTVGREPLPRIVMGSTDAILVKKGSDIPCLGFGAGDEGLAHAPNEYVTIENLVMAAQVYAVLPLVF